MIRPLLLRILDKLGPSCCDCSCADCDANGHTHTMPVFGPRHRFQFARDDLAEMAAADTRVTSSLAALDRADALDAIVALLEDIRNAVNLLIPERTPE